MPLLYGLLAGLVLGRWGVIGLFTWLFGIGIIGQIVAANTSQTVGEWSAVVLALGIFIWAMRRPAESEAKRGFLRALRLLIAICMAVTGLAAFVFFALHGFRLSESQPETWIGLGASCLCWLALLGFAKWLALDERRVLSD